MPLPIATHYCCCSTVYLRGCPVTPGSYLPGPITVNAYTAIPHLQDGHYPPPLVLPVPRLRAPLLPPPPPPPPFTHHILPDGTLVGGEATFYYVWTFVAMGSLVLFTVVIAAQPVSHPRSVFYQNALPFTPSPTLPYAFYRLLFCVCRLRYICAGKTAAGCRLCRWFCYSQPYLPPSHYSWCADCCTLFTNTPAAFSFVVDCAVQRAVAPAHTYYHAPPVVRCPAIPSYPHAHPHLCYPTPATPLATCPTPAPPAITPSLPHSS